MISVTVLIMNHDEEGLRRRLGRKCLIQPGTHGLMEATRLEKNRALGTCPLLKRIHL